MNAIGFGSQSGHVSNFRGAVDPLIELVDGDCIESDPCELRARVHDRHPVWTRLELRAPKLTSGWCSEPLATAVDRTSSTNRRLFASPVASKPSAYSRILTRITFFEPRPPPAVRGSFHQIQAITGA
jgi:hypothetical protein